MASWVDVDELDQKKARLESEEEVILRELREMEAALPLQSAAGDEVVPVAAPSTRPHHRGESKSDKAEATSAAKTLNSLLGECEKTVRDCKGFVSDAGPPLEIVRCRPGEVPPRHATFLSRPKDTGVDFTVPVKVAGYTEMIKHPITLNQIRDKCRQLRYTRVDQFLNDIRTLVSNTRQFNSSPDVHWVVRHAELLYEAAEEAVDFRRGKLQAAEEIVIHAEASIAPRLPSTPGKRKRDSVSNGLAASVKAATASDIGNVGAISSNDAMPRYSSGRKGRGGRQEPLRKKLDGNEGSGTPHGLESADTGAHSAATFEQVSEFRGELLKRLGEMKTLMMSSIVHGHKQIEIANDTFSSRLEEMNKSVLRIHAEVNEMKSSLASSQKKLSEDVLALKGSVDEFEMRINEAQATAEIDNENAAGFGAAETHGKVPKGLSIAHNKLARGELPGDSQQSPIDYKKVKSSEAGADDDTTTAELEVIDVETGASDEPSERKDSVDIAPGSDQDEHNAEEEKAVTKTDDRNHRSKRDKQARTKKNAGDTVAGDKFESPETERKAVVESGKSTSKAHDRDQKANAATVAT